MEKTNPVLKQDRAFDTWDHFNRFGYVMFRQQKSIYNWLATQVRGKRVIEAGCGNGIGTAILSQTASTIIGSDVTENNCAFARELYPWLSFVSWDINEYLYASLRRQVVVAVEVIEHVENVEQAIRNLWDACEETLWLSTPNGKDKPQPPENSQHVMEYTTQEILDMVPPPFDSTIYDCSGLSQPIRTTSDPLIYKFDKLALE